MARSCGIRIGPRRYEIVVLDGSPKKHKIAAFEAGEFDANADDPDRAAASTLKDAVKRLGVPKDNVGLVIDSGYAAFRRITLPFADDAKIEQVVKYEVESELPQWNVDDVVVDWHALAQTETASDLLITAVPKDDVQAMLDIASDAGVEPFEAELETTAMVNAAVAAELCNLDDAQLLVHIGDHSTSVVVMDAGEVREMRVIHIGALTHEVVAAPEPAEGEEGEAGEGEEVPAAPEVDPIEASRRIDQAIKRIRRELGRSLSGARTTNPIEAIYVCGIELPGLVGDNVMDVPVYILDCFEEDSGQPADGFGQLVTAYGSAVRELGGGLLKPELRREELKFTGTWERIEFPLAVAALLITTLLGVVWIIQDSIMEYQEVRGSRYWLESSNNYLVGDPINNKPGLMNPPPKEILNYANRIADRENPDPNLDPYGALMGVRDMAKRELINLKRQLGQDTAITHPQSALVGAFLVMDVLDKNHKEWRPSVWKLSSETQAKSGKDEKVVVSLHLVFHGDSTLEATSNFESFTRRLGDIPGFLEAPRVQASSLENGKGVEISNFKVHLNVGVFYADLARANDKG